MSNKKVVQASSTKNRFSKKVTADQGSNEQA